ncbi:MAG: ImmA/IrrE family metallo-endopeptidase, partial [Armatimonadota bacterium]|nr:ImmA/IrrE family metallo-endopeptidase [Armatimonadota bacterium]MDW8156246.1 ImmA/IrrE family metallo-endopeptidase [Armatimonadota bacterium]
MRRYRAPDGSVRVWFGPDEIDRLAEAELRAAGCLPPADRPVVDLERFVEAYLSCDLDQYAPLPADVLGVTEFRPEAPPFIQLNAALTRSAFDQPNPPPGALGRWRATLAHEAAHVLLHRSLVEPDPSQTSLLDSTVLDGVPAGRLFRCLKREVAFGGGTDWRERQANRCMAALLMPRSLFVQAVARAKPAVGLLPSDPVPAERLEELARKLARLFAVSREAARIRLQELGLA